MTNLSQLELTHRADLNILVGRWTYQPDASELPTAYDALASLARLTNCRFWLQDIRRRTSHYPVTNQWLLNSFFPDHAQRLGGRLCVAYLVSPTLQQLITEQDNFLALDGHSNYPFAIAFFGDESAAIEWLQTQQH